MKSIELIETFLEKCISAGTWGLAKAFHEDTINSPLLFCETSQSSSLLSIFVWKQERDKAAEAGGKKENNKNPYLFNQKMGISWKHWKVSGFCFHVENTYEMKWRCPEDHSWWRKHPDSSQDIYLVTVILRTVLIQILTFVPLLVHLSASP